MLGELAIQDDAITYYDHIKFFVDNMKHGVYPLWDPTWNGGVPNEFFLRRMGDFNPFFFLIVFLNKLGFSYHISYFSFVTAYFFLGLFGFFKLAQLMFNNTFSAFTAYLLLAFSSFVVLLFNSFLVLLLTPTIWFFYFLT